MGGAANGLGIPFTNAYWPDPQGIASGRYDVVDDSANGLYGVYEHRIDSGLLNLYGSGHSQSISTYPDRVKDGALNLDWKSFGSKPWNQDPTKLASLMFYLDDFTIQTYPRDLVSVSSSLLYEFPKGNSLDITEYGPGGNHGFGPALGGAGSVDALNGSPGWDTYYCRYVMYKQGTGQQTSTVPTTPNTYHFTIKNNPESTGWGDVYSQEKFREDSDFFPDKRYFNLVFPDDFIGTVNDSSTDKFYGRRSSSGKIYGNINIALHIENGAEIGSENYSSATLKPESTIKFDLSGNNFIYDGNRFVTLTIINNGQIVGGGGSGGRGSHVSSSVAYRVGKGGGGGGAGSGSGGGANAMFDRTGITRWTSPSLLEVHRGVGQPGWGWGEDSASISSAQKGANGASNVEWAGDLLNNSALGGASATATSNFGPLGHEGDVAPYEGGDGGDVFDFVVDPKNIPYVEIVNGLGGRIRSGGGGGGGGIGDVSASRPGVAGANTGQDAAENTSTTYDGGFAGYLVSSSDSSYTNSPVVRNEVPAQGTSSLTYSYTIHARHPDGTTRGTPGWSAAPQETKNYE